MGYLIAAILSSAAIALIFRYSEGQNMNRYVITSANYLAAILASIVLMGQEKRVISWEQVSDWGGFFREGQNLLNGSAALFSPAASIQWALLLGLITGTTFFLSFVYYQKSVAAYGVGLAGMFARLGILVPMSLSLVIWQEMPGLVQWTGIFMAFFAIVLVNYVPGTGFADGLRKTLVFLLIFGGVSDFMIKLFQKYALLEYKDVFLFIVFSVAFSISVLAAIRRGGGWTWKDMGVGFAVGIPNLFSSYFLILALNQLATAVVFPMFSSGAIVCILLGGWIFFRERLSKKDQGAVCLTMISLLLIS